MANCIIPIRVRKIGGDLDYKQLYEDRDEVVYADTEDIVTHSDVRLISNESLYDELIKLVDLFDKQQMPIILSSDESIWNVPVGELIKYCSSARKETPYSSNETPKITTRINPVKAAEVAKENKDYNGAAHTKAHTNSNSVASIAEITGTEGNHYKIEGDISEYLSCPKCSGDKSYKSGLYLTVLLSNPISEQEKSLEEDALSLLKELKNCGYAL